jgi:hypothetical protein
MWQTILTDVATYLPYIITAAAAAAAALPKAEPGSVWATVRGVIDFLALNFGNATNKKY